MFDLEYKGGNVVIITTKKETLVIDPVRSVFGLKDVVVKDAVELGTEERFLTRSPEYKVSLEGPGEYEVSDLLIRGIPAYRHLDDRNTAAKSTTAYRIVDGEIQIGVLGNIDGQLDDDQLEELGMLDILVLPIGGNGYTMDAVSAANLAGKIGPKIVVPVHWDDSKLKYEVPQDSFERFAELMKVPIIEEKKLKIKSPSSLPESMEIYKLLVS
ncbi:MAG: MBL fold metallo-hydrolase [Candidatus Nomurabacteria bacterium]|jgi:L-ascorbate metabolism protein UlaG (beta-lactamase superfamily)|nr:MBL fold metallo-hydrolase [Candidatus Nomurabacteria bacterium]